MLANSSSTAAGTGPKSSFSSEPWDTGPPGVGILLNEIIVHSERTSEARISAGQKLLEEKAPGILQARRFLEQPPPRRQVRVVAVPRGAAVEERVAGVERRAERRVVCRIERAQPRKGARSDAGRVDQLAEDKVIERIVLRVASEVEIAQSGAEERAVVELTI